MDMVPIEFGTPCQGQPNAARFAAGVIFDACGEHECGYCAAHGRSSHWVCAMVPDGPARVATTEENASRWDALDKAYAESDAERCARTAETGRGTHVTAFYSYLGDARTAEMVRFVEALADDGHKVFVIDLDLYAPSLHFKLLNDDARARLCPGFVELAHKFISGGYIPPIGDYTVVANRPDKKGELRLMPAGRALSGDYWKTLAGLRWQDLFGVDFGDGMSLLLDLKDAIRETFQPEHIVLDVRSGITELGGAALSFLADDVVVVSTNDPASEWGTSEVIRAIPRVPRPPGVAPVNIRRIRTGEVGQ
jgi:hypothetical protein